MKFAKFLRVPILKNIRKGLLLTLTHFCYQKKQGCTEKQTL